MMSSLLPSLDASIDSHFSLTDTTDATQVTGSSTTNGYHTSGTSFHTSASGSTLHSDLGDSSGEEEADEMMSSSRRMSHRLIKAFGKITKKSSSSSKKARSNKMEKDKKTSSVPKYFDKADVDDSEEEEEEEEETPGSSEFHSARDTSNPEQAQPRRRGGACKSIASNNNNNNNNRNSRRPRSSDAGSDDNVEYSSQEEGVRPQRRNRRSSTSRSQDRSEDPRQSRSSSRRGGGRASCSGGLVGKRMPPKSKSFDDPGRKVTRPAGFSRSESYKERHRKCAKSSNITAKEAIPNPRPNLRKHKSERRQSSSVHQSRKPTGKANNNNMSKARSFRKSKSSVGGETGQPLPVKERASKKTFRRSRSLTEDESEDIPRVSSFQSFLDQQTAPRERSASRNRDKRKGTTTINSAAPVETCKHDETLGECCYDKHPKNSSKKTTAESEPPPLNSFIDSRAVDPAAGDDLSIDTMDTHVIRRELRNKTNKQERRRSKSRSRSPSVTRAGARSKSRSRSPSVTSRSKSRSRSPSISRGQPNRRRSASLARNGNSERGRRSSLGIPVPPMEKRVPSSRRLGSDGTSERGKRSSLERKEKGTRNKPGVRNGSSERGRRSSSSGENPERERSESRSKRGSATQSKRGRSKSACRDGDDDAKNGSSHARLPSVNRPVRSRSNSKTRKEAPRKQYETLSKEDLALGGLGADSAANRRPRSLSRTRRSGDKNKKAGQELLRDDQNARVSRSLSRTRGGSNQGIGNYLASKQPERKSEDDESNSQTTGSNTTGSHEVTYSTPSWMWSKGNTSAATGSLQNSFQTSNSSSFNNSFQTAKTSHDSFQTSGSTLMDSSFETAASEMTAAAGSASADTGKTGNHDEDNGSVAASTSSLTATPGTKAKHFYGKIMEKEQAEIRAQSQQLFQNVISVKSGNGPRPAARP